MPRFSVSRKRNQVAFPGGFAECCCDVAEGLLYVDPTNKLCVKITKGLLAHQKKGRWESTQANPFLSLLISHAMFGLQENCFILIALDKYFRIFEKDVPDFVTRSALPCLRLFEFCR